MYAIFSTVNKSDNLPMYMASITRCGNFPLGKHLLMNTLIYFAINTITTVTYFPMI